MNRFVEETEWYNSIVLGLLPESWWVPYPRLVQTWLRNYVGATLIYLLSSLFWSLYMYGWRRRRTVYVPRDKIPSIKAIGLQIQVAMRALPFYCALPTLSEYVVEKGWTQCYSSIGEVGWFIYIVHLGIYLVLCEIGIYWMHRALHDIKPLYKHLHATHHIYNKENTLSPFAGLAFHPLDGILQAAPHVICLFLVPTHFRTHMLLLFAEGLWTANIHDCIHGRMWPVMGAGYHAIHHTTYRHNYGHYTVWMDWMFGTLRDPEDNSKNKDDDDSMFGTLRNREKGSKNREDRMFGTLRDREEKYVN